MQYLSIDFLKNFQKLFSSVFVDNNNFFYNFYMPYSGENFFNPIEDDIY